MESKQLEAIAALESKVKAVVDPLPPATLGMYLFLASEAMFFVGLLGAFIVLKSAGEQQEVFAKSAAALNRVIGLASVTSLLMSSVSILGRRVVFRWITLALACSFLAFQCLQWRLLLQAGYNSAHDNFWGCYYLIGAVHILHLLVGMIAVLWFTVFRLGKVPDSLQIYWHFVNAVGVMPLIAIYLF